MKNKSLLLVLFLVIFNISFAQNAWYYGTEGEEIHLTKISTYRILMSFKDGVSFEDKNDVIWQTNNIVYSKTNKANILNEIGFEQGLSNKVQFVMNLNNDININDVIFLINTLRKNTKIKYANYFYFKGPRDGIIMHAFDDCVGVKLKSQYSEQDVEILSKKLNIINEGLSAYTRDIYYFEIIENSKMDATELARILYETGMFYWAQPNFIAILPNNSIHVNDTYYANQWAIPFMNIDKAWEYTTGSSEVRIAILDNGVDLTHPDLVNNLLKFENKVVGYDCFFEQDVIPGSFTNDDSHGTQCAGCLGAEGNNNIGVAGVAYNSKIIPVRVSKDAEDGKIFISYKKAAIALTWAVFNDISKADVVSISFGDYTGEAHKDIPFPFRDAIIQANIYGRDGRGVPVVVASGNTVEGYGHTICFPANMSNTIAVGAINQEYRRADFSCYEGNTLDLVAPGTNIVTTDINNSYTVASPVQGTSFSAPYIAGVFALMYSIKPNLLYQEAKEILLTNCIKPENYYYEYHDEYGLWNTEVGHGYPDVEDILQALNVGNSNLIVNVSTIPSNILPGDAVSFTAYCENATGNINYTWLINKAEGELNGPCNYENSTCNISTINPTEQYVFSDLGNYHIYVQAVDENSNYGEKELIINVGYTNDPCILVNFDSYLSGQECVQTYDVEIGEYQLVGYALEHCEKYHGIKAIEWFLDGISQEKREFLYDEYRNYIPRWCFNFTGADLGEHDITFKAYAGKNNTNYEFVYALNNNDSVYSLVTKQINVINSNRYVNFNQFSWEHFYVHTGLLQAGTVFFNHDEKPIFIDSDFEIIAKNTIIINSETVITENSNFIAKIDNSPPPPVCNCFDNLFINKLNNRSICRSGYSNSSIFEIEKSQNFDYNLEPKIINKKVDENLINVLPNPFNDYLKIVIEVDNVFIEAELIDITGKIISYFTFTENTNTISTKHLKQGFYLLKLYDGSNYFYKKIVKQ